MWPKWYGKTPLKIFSKTKRPMTLKLAIQHRGLGPDKIYLNDDPGLALTFLQQGEICSLMLFMGKCFNARFYGNYWSIWTESWYIQLTDYMNTYEYKRSRSLFDLGPKSLRFILSNIFCSKATGPTEEKINVEPLWIGEMTICQNGTGHVTKMAAMPIHCKCLEKSSSYKPTGRLPWNLV